MPHPPTGWETFQGENYLNANYQEKFKEEEKIQTRNSIKELRGNILGLELPAPTPDAINRKLDDLSNKIDGLSKFDRNPP